MTETDSPTGDSSLAENSLEPGTSENITQEASDELAVYEQLFKDRFTDSDAGFMKTVDRDLAPPPCVHNWYSRPKRSFDYSRSQNEGDSGYRGRGRGHRGGHRGNQWDGEGHRNQWQGHQGHRQNSQGYGHRQEGYENRQGGYGHRQGGYEQRGGAQRDGGYGRGSHGHGDRQNYHQGYDRRGDHGQRGRHDSHEQDRVHYAGMKQSDGRTSRGHQSHGGHPYQR